MNTQIIQTLQLYLTNLMQLQNASAELCTELYPKIVLKTNLQCSKYFKDKKHYVLSRASCLTGIKEKAYNLHMLNTVVPPYLRVIRSTTYCGYAKLRIIPKAKYNMIFV
jgi:hypothetical protein